MAQMSTDAGPEQVEPEEVVRTSPVLWVVLGAGILRVLAVIGQNAIVWADSPTYENLDFTGRSMRPWVTPLLYELIEANPKRVIVQAVIGGLCWGFLALQAARLAYDERVRWGILLAILALSLTTAVTSWDATVLSESLALSFGALLLGALIRWAGDPRWPTVALVLVGWTLWIWTRQAHLLLGLAAVATLAVVLVAGAVRHKGVARSSWGLLAGLAVLTGLAVVTYSRNTHVVHYNLNQIIDARILSDPDDTQWFVDRGMPEPGDEAARRRIGRWIDTDGVGVYVRYLALHPWDTLTDPLESLVSDRPPFADKERGDEVMLASPDRYGVGREVLPEVVEDLLFGPGQAGVVVFVFVGVVGLTAWEWRRRGADRRWTIPLVVLGLQIPALIAVYHSSTAELGRLALPSAVLIRITLLVQLGLLVERRVSGGLAPPDGGPVDLVDGGGDPAAVAVVVDGPTAGVDAPVVVDEDEAPG